MSTPQHDAKTFLIDKVVARITEKLPPEQASLVGAFTREFFLGVAADDLLERSPLDLYGAALAQWHLASRRQPGERLIHVYNPNLEEHGWQSTHTVVEVVQDDMPFLVDSIAAELNRHGLTVHLIVHPVLRVCRDDQGRITALADGADTETALAEAVMHFEVDRQTDTDVLAALHQDLERVLGDVAAAVADWPAMRERLRTVLGELERQPPPVGPEEWAETRAFLEWLDQDHFTFIGYREYLLEERDGDEVLRLVPDSGLGILRHAVNGELSRSFAQLPPEARALAHSPEPLILTKSSSRATVHRPGYLDYVGIKRFDEQGQPVGEWRFLGLYTSAAYNRRPYEIPLLRRKVQRVVAAARLRPHSHSAKALLNILETLPRDELFQSDEHQLLHTAMAILHLQERQRVRLVLRRDPFQRFLSCLVYLPREAFNTTVRLRIQEILERAFNATEVEFSIWVSESVLARLYYTVHTAPGALLDYDAREIEARIAEACRSWRDDLHDALVQELGEEAGNRLFARYRDAFPASYQEDYPAQVAVHDIKHLEAVCAEDPVGVVLYHPLEAVGGELRLKLFRAAAPISLSVVLPMLENMGVRVLDERPHEIRRAGEPAWVQDIGMLYERGPLEAEQIRHVFQDAFQRIWRGDVENDGFNRLVLDALLSWRRVAMLRAYCKYLRQTGLPFSQSYIEAALARHPQIASLLVDLFVARFDPALGEAAAKRCESLEHAIIQSLEEVPNLDDDRILRRFLAVIQATLRTNYFQRDAAGAPRDRLALKLDPTRIPELPEPRPQYEIFVYSPRVEGVHLRGGKVARGGIRWSDRREDFRTEIFGLMKAQMVKNAVIVPVGAKGGFVVKTPPPGADRRALQEEGLACYRSFIRALLDVTDNLDSDGRVLPPEAVVRYDSDDPYLVVAADKGTATFSDTANAVAAEYGFWLGDAFASGGSAGYDHKKMGITARGAWESVKRHFRERGTDVQQTDFTVIGIGSMNGDVFGNGMLLSRHIKLIAAFSHAHIFLDPDPDPEASYRERERLFALPRCTWADYDPGLLSEGGGVFERSAKSIALSPQVRAALQVEAEALPPNELIRAMLRAPVDLLWNGAIGTFVKAGSEDHMAVGDRANDAIRINAAELRCKVVGEGGNLGFTQAARVEYALRGGRVNADFIDNSGGVDCSDHEVNIKILLDGVVRAGDLSEKQRNRLLRDMTDEVAELVLADSYQQTAALSMAEYHAPALLGEHARFMGRLEKAARLERDTWHLPDDEELARRRTAGRGLARPELAVLLSYSKIGLFDALLASDLCEEAYLTQELSSYFPGPVRARFAAQMLDHRLRREMVAAVVANTIINRMGITFPSRLEEDSGAPPAESARAFLATRAIFDLPALWRDIEALDNEVPAALQMDMFTEMRRLANRGTLWFLRSRKAPLDVAGVIDEFSPGVRELAAKLPALLDAQEQAHLQERIAQRVGQGVPDPVAKRLALLAPLFSALDIIEVAGGLNRPVAGVAQFYFSLAARLEVPWLRDQINALPEDSHWARLARAAARDDLHYLLRGLVQRALAASPEPSPKALLDSWQAVNDAAVARYRQRVAEFKAAPGIDLALLSVALNELRTLLVNTAPGN